MASSQSGLILLLLSTWLLVVCLEYVSVTAKCTAGISLESYEALESLYYSTGGSKWRWNPQQLVSTIWHFPCDLDTPCSSGWQGLECNWNSNGTMCEISAVLLQYRNLTGQIPSQLGMLRNLEVLYLSNNSLNGTIPPELGNLSSLRQLQLAGNLLIGAIPSELSNLIHLEELVLADNLLDGTISSDFGNLVNLQQLYLNNNSLIGSLPSELGKLVNLTVLYLCYNSFEGTLVSELSNLVDLDGLFLNDNSFTGSIPSELGNLLSLEELVLSNNILDSSIPSELGNLANVKEVALNNNALRGSIASQLGYLANLEVLYLDDNSLAGTLSTHLGNLLKLRVLYVNDNSLSGAIPLELGKLTALEALYLNKNRFTGHFELSAYYWPLLLILNVSSNMLSKSISIANDTVLSLQQLQVLDMSNNRFSGSLVDALFALPSLRTIILSQNCFGGTLPTSLCWNNILENIVLDLLTANCGDTSIGIFQGVVVRQYMQGTIPSCIWNSSTIHTLHLLGNGLTGSVEALPDGSQLSILSLASNQLTGTIPTTLQQHNFDQLDLSSNRFSGTLESRLVFNVTPTVYDFSSNRISGVVPSFLYSLNTETVNVLQGNLFACGPQGAPRSDVSYASYPCGSVDVNYSLFAWAMGVCVTVVSVVIMTKLGSDLVRQVASVSKSAEVMKVLGGPFWCMAVLFVASTGYISIKLLGGEIASTHSMQYWWTSGVVFTHDWVIYVVLLLFLMASCNFFVSAMWTLTAKTMPSSNSSCLTGVGNVKSIGAHVLNIVVATAANAIYVLVVVGSIDGFALLVIQAVLGISKLVWSGVIIPRLVSMAGIDSSWQLSHWIFMVLFTFLGAPFASAFCESSSCFLYVIKRSPTTSFSFFIPTIDITGVCDVQGCNFVFGSTYQLFQSTVVPPWMYSYQCSSIVITNYAPVLLFSYLVSGFVYPTTLILIANNKLSDFLSVAPVKLIALASADKLSAKSLLENCAVTELAQGLSTTSRSGSGPDDEDSDMLALLGRWPQFRGLRVWVG
jgi:Leucine-rich repeat (LRR) protein